MTGQFYLGFKASRRPCRPKSTRGEPVADATPFAGDVSWLSCSSRVPCNSSLLLRTFVRSVESSSLSIVNYVGNHTPVGPPPMALPVSDTGGFTRKKKEVTSSQGYWSSLRTNTEWGSGSHNDNARSTPCGGDQPLYGVLGSGLARRRPRA